MSYIVHDLQIDPTGQLPPAVVVKIDARQFQIAERDEAIACAVDQLRAAGIAVGALTRVARTPSGGWSVSFRLA